MDEYISRKWISNAIHNFFCGIKHSVTEEDIQAYISATPSADVRENIHGHWIEHKEYCKNLGVKPSGLGAFKWCSRCNCGIDVREWHINDYNYCPNCGADMREDQNE